jgi:hypothetical protein
MTAHRFPAALARHRTRLADNARRAMAAGRDFPGSVVSGTLSRPAGVRSMSVRFIVIMLALTLMTLGLGYLAIPGSGSFDAAAPTPTARSE